MIIVYVKIYIILGALIEIDMFQILSKRYWIVDDSRHYMYWVHIHPKAMIVFVTLSLPLRYSIDT